MFWIILSFLAICVTVFLLTRWRLRQLVIDDLSSRFILVTGCDSGFGNLLVKKLDSLGINVFAMCYTKEAVDIFKRTSSRRVIPLQLDVTKQENIDRIYEEVKSSLPCGKGLWALVNNAGIMGSSYLNPTEWCTVDNFHEVMDVNLYGQVRMTVKFLPLIRKESGRIVNMSSISGRTAVGSGPYVCSKFAAEGFADVLRVELYRTGVTVHVLEPSGYRTNFVVSNNIINAMTSRYAQLDDERKNYYGENFLQLCRRNAKYESIFLSTQYSDVVDAYTHALTAQWPKARYVVGFQANTIYRFLWNVPEWLSAYLISRGWSVNPEGLR